MDYRQALQTACDAALVGGAILRADFHRPQGARGGGSKAEADIQAELEIRTRLRSAFPAWRYVGEETGIEAGDERDGHCWVVDPNDGTQPYLAGHRGSAVSIGLLREGVPVLGVVYAFGAPDDDGDLIAWAEDLPMTRNGKPLPPRTWPDALGPYDVVLLSQAAERKPLAFSELVSPARFRTVPSIAYRLALVAAGDGVMTLSLNGPGDYDYGAGHALLRGAGGELVDDKGEPVRYTRDGQSRVRFCFGGSLRLAQALSRRPWAGVFGVEALAPDEYQLLRPVPGHVVSTPAVLRRAQGCWLGQLSGDALGSQVEFETPAVIARMHPGGVRTMQDGGTFGTLSGQPTDDSEMALGLARSLVDIGHYDVEAVTRAYVAWLHSNPFDRGTTVSTALDAVTEADLAAGRGAAKARQRARADSQANGALMRISPLGIWGAHLDPWHLASLARADAALTHPHPVCQDSNVAFVLAIACAIRTGATPEEVYGQVLEASREHRLEPSVVKALEAAAGAPPADFLSHQGWVLIALQNAFYRLLHGSLEDGVVATVGAGGDTDTNAAIAGALLGAVHGRDAVPFDWRTHVLSCRAVYGLERVKRPRPQGMWPVDALALAERLLYCGTRVEAHRT